MTAARPARGAPTGKAVDTAASPALMRDDCCKLCSAIDDGRYRGLVDRQKEARGVVHRILANA